MAERKRLTLEDITMQEQIVFLSDEVEISIHPLSFDQILHLMTEYRSEFLAMYGQSQSKEQNEKGWAGVLMSCPDVVAKVIAMSMGDIAMWEKVKTGMSATHQYTALKAIWGVSVPDPKALVELLSGATGLLQSFLQQSTLTQKTTSLPSLVTN